MPTDNPHLEEYAREQYARAHAWQERAERAEKHVESLRQALQAIADNAFDGSIAEFAEKALRATEQ
jgi:hypothetical protein